MDTSSRVLAGLRSSVIFLGLFGNAITFIIYSRPAFEKNSISTYCRALAIFDCFTIVEFVYDGSIALFGFVLTNYTDLNCVMFYYIAIAFGAIPGWILIAFSIDKLLSMKNMGNSIIKRRLFQYIVIISIVLVNLLLYIVIPIELRLVSLNYTNNTLMICDLTSLRLDTFVSGMYLIEGSILPFLIMFTTSIISIRLIRKSSKNLNKTQTGFRDTRNKRDARFAVTSIVFNFMFIILKLPIIVLAVLKTLIPGLNSTDLLLEVTYLVYFLNFSIGLIVHLISNNLFRSEFCQVFRLKKPTIEQSRHRSNSSLNRNRIVKNTVLNNET